MPFGAITIQHQAGARPPIERTLLAGAAKTTGGFIVLQRTVIQAESLSWLAEHPADPAASVITSLPDVSEMPERGFDGWQAWFVEAAGTILEWIPPEGVAIFFQSDIRRRGIWIDKGQLVLRAAERANASFLWHKIVCRKPAGTPSQGRATYSHMLCFSRSVRPCKRPWPDVLPDAGFMPWPKAMGVQACRLACDFVRLETACRLVVDPFCGYGTALAVANALGLDALGIDLCARRCRAARSLVVDVGPSEARASLGDGGAS